MESKKDPRMDSGFILAALILYILMGAVTIVVFAFDTGLLGEKKQQPVKFTPAPYSTDTETVSDIPDTVNDYDTGDGTAGAARDL